MGDVVAGLFTLVAMFLVLGFFRVDDVLKARRKERKRILDFEERILDFEERRLELEERKVELQRLMLGANPVDAIEELAEEVSRRTGLPVDREAFRRERAHAEELVTDPDADIHAKMDRLGKAVIAEMREP